MCEAKIISNLKGFSCIWVNYFCVINGLTAAEAADPLKRLVRDGRIETQTVNLGQDQFRRPLTGTLYRLKPNAGSLIKPQLVTTP